MRALTGANGRLGREIATAVAAAGRADEFVLLTRDPDQAADLRELGFLSRRADFGDVATLSEALCGVEALLMISATGPASERVPLHRGAFEAIKNSDVRRVVYTSRVAPYSSSPYPFAEIHEDSERILKSLGVSYTILRNNEYCENLEFFLEQAVRTGALHYGAKGPIAFISRSDVVAAAVAAILDDRNHHNRIYELSGPEALDRFGLASELSAATGRTIEITDGSAEDFGETVRSAGAPDFIAEMCVGLYRASESGEWSATMPDDVRALIGHSPTPVSTYIRTEFAGNRLVD